jgi:hypothetical protein
MLLLWEINGQSPAKLTMKCCNFNSVISWFVSVINMKMGTRSEFQDWKFCTSFHCNWEGWKTEFVGEWCCTWEASQFYWSHLCMLAWLLLSSTSMYTVIPLLHLQNFVAVVMLPAHQQLVTQVTEWFSMNNFLEKNLVPSQDCGDCVSDDDPCMSQQHAHTLYHVLVMYVSTFECRQSHATYVLWMRQTFENSICKLCASGFCVNLFCISGCDHQGDVPVMTYHKYQDGCIGKLHVCCIIPTYYMVRKF